MDLYKRFGKRLAEVRKNKHLTQAEAAKQLGTVQSTYSGYELGTRRVNLDIILDLANLFEVSPDYLLSDMLSQENDNDQTLYYPSNEKLELVKDRYAEAEPPIQVAVDKLLDIDEEIDTAVGRYREGLRNEKKRESGVFPMKESDVG